MKYTIEKVKEIENKFSTEFYGIAYRNSDNGMLVYIDADTATTYMVDFLTDDEVKKLMEKSLKDGINHLFEKVKDHEYIPYYEPDCLY